MSVLKYIPQSLSAPSDYSANQYLAVKNVGSRVMGLSTTSSLFYGILQDEPDTADEMGLVATMGPCKAKISGSVAVGDILKPHTDSKLIAVTGAKPGVAVAMQVGVDGQVIDVQLFGSVEKNRKIYTELVFPIALASLADADILTGFNLPFDGTIVSAHAVVDVVTTDADADAIINMEIGSTNVTGGVLTLADDNCDTLGAVIDASAVTAAADFDAGDDLALECTGTTAFADGHVSIHIWATQNLY